MAKRYFAPRPRGRVRRAAARSFIPTLYAALRRRRSERRFVKLCKQLSRRRMRRETQTTRRQRKRRGRKHRRYTLNRHPSIKPMAKGL